MGVSLLQLISYVAPRQRRLGMAACKRVKHSNVKKRTLSILTPKVPSHLIKTCTILMIGCGIMEWFIIQGLKGVSILTSLHTSLRRSAVKLRSSLWRIDGKPPQGQLKACWTEKVPPHTQDWGRFRICHPKCRHRASLNSPWQNHDQQWGGWSTSLTHHAQKQPQKLASMKARDDQKRT